MLHCCQRLQHASSPGNMHTPGAAVAVTAWLHFVLSSLSAWMTAVWVTSFFKNFAGAYHGAAAQCAAARGGGSSRAGGGTGTSCEVQRCGLQGSYCAPKPHLQPPPLPTCRPAAPRLLCTLQARCQPPLGRPPGLCTLCGGDVHQSRYAHAGESCSRARALARVGDGARGGVVLWRPQQACSCPCPSGPAPSHRKSHTHMHTYAVHLRALGRPGACICRCPPPPPQHTHRRPLLFACRAGEGHSRPLQLPQPTLCVGDDMCMVLRHVCECLQHQH
jgi:hypothetical protein